MQRDAFFGDGSAVIILQVARRQFDTAGEGFGLVVLAVLGEYLFFHHRLATRRIFLMVRHFSFMIQLLVAHQHMTPDTSGLFPETKWSMIQGANTEAEAASGLERLARAYWRPLYVFIRQRGVEYDVAADQVQGFFEHLLARDTLADVKRGEVRFRSFLLRCFSNWLANQRRDATRQKRGGGVQIVSLEDARTLEEYQTQEEGLSPDLAYDRRWARALVDQAMRRLDAEHSERDRSDFLREVRQRVFAADGSPDWEALATEYGMSNGAVRKAATDMRRRFGALLREEVRQVVANEAEVDDELRYLVSLMANP